MTKRGSAIHFRTKTITTSIITAPAAAAATPPHTLTFPKHANAKIHQCETEFMASFLSVRFRFFGFSYPFFIQFGSVILVILFSQHRHSRRHHGERI